MYIVLICTYSFLGKEFATDPSSLYMEVPAIATTTGQAQLHGYSEVPKQLRGNAMSLRVCKTLDIHVCLSGA